MPASWLSTLEIADVLRQILDVRIGQGRGDGCHVARVVGSAPRLEVRELLLDVLRPLPGDTGYLILSDKAAQVAHRTEHSVGNLAARLDLGAVSLELDRQYLLRRKKLAELDHVVARKVGCHRRHLRVAAAAFVEILELD